MPRRVPGRWRPPEGPEPVPICVSQGVCEGHRHALVMHGAVTHLSNHRLQAVGEQRNQQYERDESSHVGRSTFQGIDPEQ